MKRGNTWNLAAFGSASIHALNGFIRRQVQVGCMRIEIQFVGQARV